MLDQNCLVSIPCPRLNSLETNTLHSGTTQIAYTMEYTPRVVKLHSDHRLYLDVAMLNCQVKTRISIVVHFIQNSRTRNTDMTG